MKAAMTESGGQDSNRGEVVGGMDRGQGRSYGCLFRTIDAKLEVQVGC